MEQAPWQVFGRASSHGLHVQPRAEPGAGLPFAQLSQYVVPAGAGQQTLARMPILAQLVRSISSEGGPHQPSAWHTAHALDRLGQASETQAANPLLTQVPPKILLMDKQQQQQDYPG